MLYTIKTTQFLNTDLETAWGFISSPQNLAKITPPHMGFDVLTPAEELKEMYPGQIIEYYVSPLLGIKIHWVTEITQVVPRKYFVDEQRFGPYAFWHHKHFLKEVEGGVEMTDLIHYKLPLGVFGRIAQALFVKRQLKDIFAYRRIALDKLFISDIAKSEINQIECRISDFVYYSAETSSIQR